jgi:hypothetical protein
MLNHLMLNLIEIQVMVSALTCWLYRGMQDNEISNSRKDAQTRQPGAKLVHST